jgi:tetratricopeptide (TPR) repeat protein
MENGPVRAARYQGKRVGQLAAASTVILIFSAAFGFWSVREFRAARLASRSAAAPLERAVALEPGNAEYLARLGRYHLLLAQSPKAAITDFRRSLALNPYSAQAQLDLAAALAAAGDEAGQQQALAAALAAEPTNPHVAWTVGNWSLARGENAAALEQFRVVVENDPESAPAAINLAWRRSHDVERMLAVTIPPAVNPRLEFLEYLISQREPEAAAAVWEKVAQSGERLPLQVPLDYIGWRLSRREWAGALADWRRLQQLNAELRAYASEGNLIVNSGFEQPILNAAWDWRTDPPQGVELSTDVTALHSGARSLLIEFHDATAAGAGISQLVAVEPQTRYFFRAFWKADDLVTAAPPSWAVRDTETGTIFFSSEPIVGTSGWREVRGEFATGARTAAVEILLVRPAEPTIRGRLALDDVALSKEPLP